MTNALKEHEKEFTKISNEVKKFISSAGPKSGAENDEALAKRKNELKDALITISARTAELKQEGGNKKSDVKFEANKKKLLSKMNDLRIKLEGYTVETETKTLKPKTSRGSPRRRRKKEKQGETVADENLDSEKAKMDDDKEAIERDIDKKEGELSTGDVQSIKEEIEESEDDEETAAGDKISEKSLSVPQKEKNEKLPKTAEEKRSESTEDTFHTEPEDKSEALDEEITELDEDTDVTNLGKPESHVVKSGEADSTMDDVTVSQLEGGLGDDSEEGEEKSEAKDKGNLNMMESVEKYIAIRGWTGEESGDLSFKNGEILTVLEKNEDGWWLARNAGGEKGLVPMNFLQGSVEGLPGNNGVNTTVLFPNVRGGKNRVQNESQEVLSLHEPNVGDSTEVNSIQDIEQAKHTDTEEYQDEFTLDEESQDLEEMKSTAEQLSVIPELKIQEEASHYDSEEETDAANTDSTREINKETIEKPIIDKKTRNIVTTAATWMGQNNSRILKAFETLPKCVRVSTLASMDPQEFNYQTYLSPRLGASQLMFADLIYVENEGQAMRRNAKWQRILSIQKCVQMPSLDETDVQILERTVRICLFNGQKPVSNICTIPMVTSDREKKTWIPCPLNMRKDSRPNELNGDLFIRFSESDPNVYILIEVGISAKKPSTASSATDNVVELSVGWVCVPLYSENGTATPNKTTDYPIYAGNPYEGAVLEQEQPKDETLRGRIQQFIYQKVPQMTVRLSNPNKEQTGMLNGLPDNLVGFTGYLQFFNIYWDLLAQALFGNKVASRRGSAFLRQVPIYVAMFPYVADTPLLMEALRVSWNDRVKTIPAARRKEPEIMRKLYSEHFMKVIYPITSVLDIIPTGFTPYWLFEKKTPYVLTMLQAVQSDLPRFFSSTEYKFRPLTAREYTCPVRMSTQMLWS